jgi:D-tagatose-1,6-bisphosphate aldolase subunit GatZ/KbaZ
VAQRAAELAKAAEAAYSQLAAGRPAPRYIIGTEVPPPGGIQEGEEELAVTQVRDAEETIETTREAFMRLGLEAAWERVMAVVVQPGVEYGDDTIHDYVPERAADLSRFIENYNNLVYEVHSTDYQTRWALRRLVEDHFAVLKVGPALTFAFREAVFALAMMEEEMLSGRADAAPSDVRGALEAAMMENPVYWETYYLFSETAQRFARKYSFSDRSRYYWPVSSVQAALSALIANLTANPPPLSLLSQFLPVQYERIRNGTLANTPRVIMLDHIGECLDDYAYACGR